MAVGFSSRECQVDCCHAVWINDTEKKEIHRYLAVSLVEEDRKECASLIHRCLWRRRRKKRMMKDEMNCQFIVHDDEERERYIKAGPA